MIGTVICPSCDTATEVDEADLARFRQEQKYPCGSCNADLTERMNDLVTRVDGPPVQAPTDDVDDEEAFDGLPMVAPLDAAAGNSGAAASDVAAASAADAPALPSFPAPPSVSAGASAVAGAGAAASIVPPDMSSADTVPDFEIPDEAAPVADALVAEGAYPDNEETIPERTPVLPSPPGAVPARVQDEVTVKKESPPRPIGRAAQLTPVTGRTRIGLLGIRVIGPARPVVRPNGSTNGRAIPVPKDDTVVSGSPEDQTVAGAPAAPASEETVASAPIPTDDTVASAPVPDELMEPTVDEKRPAAAPVAALEPEPDPEPALEETAPPAVIPDLPPSAAATEPGIPGVNGVPDVTATQKTVNPPSEEPTMPARIPRAPIATASDPTPAVQPGPPPLEDEVSPPPTVGATGRAASLDTIRPPGPAVQDAVSKDYRKRGPQRLKPPPRQSRRWLFLALTPLALGLLALAGYGIVTVIGNQTVDPTATPTEVAVTQSPLPTGRKTVRPTATAVRTKTTPPPTPVASVPKATPTKTPVAGLTKAEKWAKANGYVKAAKAAKSKGDTALAITKLKSALKFVPTHVRANCALAIWSGGTDKQAVRLCKKHAPKDDDERKMVEKYFSN